MSILFALISKYIHNKFNYAIFLRESIFLLYKLAWSKSLLNGSGHEMT